MPKIPILLASHSISWVKRAAIFAVVYLFLFITVMIAHVVGGGGVLYEITKGFIPLWLAALIYVLVFSPAVYLGTEILVDRLNLLLMVGVVVSYFTFIGFSYNHVNFELLTYTNWPKAWLAIPVLFTAFTYQVIVPTLMTYMNGNAKKVKFCIIIGTTIPLLIYLVWELLILASYLLKGLEDYQA